jgi:hypothetical protein
MIGINSELQNYIDLGFKPMLQKLFDGSGVPKKYQFKELEKDWSIEFSPHQKLTGSGKKRSQMVQIFIKSYIDAIDPVLNNTGLRVHTKNSVEIVTDILLDGSKSSGKTFLCSIIAQAALMKGYKVKFINWIEYSDIFQTFDSRETNEKYFDECINADLLIIDSIFDYQNSNNKFFNMQIDRLISTRQNQGKVTICAIDSSSGVPVYGAIWNRFTRETFTLKLPEAAIKK